MKEIKLHNSKLWGFLFPIFAKEAIGMFYETLATEIQKKFRLTPEQWEIVLREYEFLHEHIAPDAERPSASSKWPTAQAEPAIPQGEDSIAINPNSRFIMDCPNSYIAVICSEFVDEWEQYVKLAHINGKEKLAWELDNQASLLSETATKISEGKILSHNERNELRSTIKHWSKIIAVELCFPKQE